MNLNIGTIRHKRATAAGWVAQNPTLAAGEIGIETDTKKIKIGDGTSNWNALSYQKIDAADVNNLVSSLSSKADTNQTFHIGTTQLAINRASGTQTLNGVSIDGNAATVTNGVVTTGSYSNPSWITSLDDSKVLPTQTDNTGKFLTTDGTDSSWADVSWSTLSGKPSTFPPDTHDHTTVTAVTNHVGDADPHTQYLKETDAEKTYQVNNKEYGDIDWDNARFVALGYDASIGQKQSLVGLTSTSNNPSNITFPGHSQLGPFAAYVNQRNDWHYAQSETLTTINVTSGGGQYSGHETTPQVSGAGFTCEGWFKPEDSITEFGKSEQVIFNMRGVIVSIDLSMNVRVRCVDYYQYINPLLYNDQVVGTVPGWFGGSSPIHLALVIDGLNFKIYSSGTLRGTLTMTQGSYDEWYSGKTWTADYQSSFFASTWYQVSTGAPYKGYATDLRIYNIAKYIGSTYEVPPINKGTFKSQSRVPTGGTAGQYLTKLNVNSNQTQWSTLPSFQLASEKGAANGYASLDAGGLVPSNQLPSFVDDVLEYANLAAFPVTGETAKIYVALDTGRTYRWSGSIYTEISPSDVLSVNGETGTVVLTLDDIDDVILTTPSNDQILKFNGTNWVNGAAPGATISGVADTTTYYVPVISSATGSLTDVRVDSADLYYTSGDQTLYATNINTASDANLKTNILKINNSIDIVNQLRGVSFDWKLTGKKSYGVIAQEVEQVLPDIVGDTNGRKSVNYSALIGVLIEAVKKQGEEIEMLKEQIKGLTNGT